MNNNLEYETIVDNQSSKKIVRKRVGLFVLGIILLFCVIVGKEIIEELIFEGYIYIEPKGKAKEASELLTDEEYYRLLYLSEHFQKTYSNNWSSNINYEEGVDDTALYVYTQTQEKREDSLTLIDVNCNDAYTQKYENRILFRMPETDNLHDIIFNDVYNYDMKLNKNSCSWLYQGEYLGCRFQGEAIYIFDDAVIITKIFNFKWNFRNKYIKLKSVENNLDYDFKGIVNENN